MSHVLALHCRVAQVYSATFTILDTAQPFVTDKAPLLFSLNAGNILETMGVYRVPSRAESEPASLNTQVAAVPVVSKTCLRGMTIFIEQKRIYYRPTLWPTIKATDLALEAFEVIKDACGDPQYPITDLKGLMEQATDMYVFVHFKGPPGFYLRTSADVEGDANLWEEVLNHEFPDRHAVRMRGAAMADLGMPPLKTTYTVETITDALEDKEAGINKRMDMTVVSALHEWTWGHQNHP